MMCDILLTNTGKSMIIQHFNMKRIFKFPEDIKNFKQIVFRQKGWVMVMHTKLPMGIENFERIRKEGFYYVDKTGLIRIFWKIRPM